MRKDWMFSKKIGTWLWCLDTSIDTFPGFTFKITGLATKHRVMLELHILWCSISISGFKDVYQADPEPITASEIETIRTDFEKLINEELNKIPTSGMFIGYDPASTQSDFSTPDSKYNQPVPEEYKGRTESGEFTDGRLSDSEAERENTLSRLTLAERDTRGDDREASEQGKE